MNRSHDAFYDARIDEWLPPVDDFGLRIWESTALPLLGVISTRDHSHVYPTHIHDCVELIWIHSGTGKITCRGKTYALKPGDLWLIAPNELHSTYTEICTFTIVHVPSAIYWPLVLEKTKFGWRSNNDPLCILRVDGMEISLVPQLDALMNASSTASLYAQLSRLLETILMTPYDFSAPQVEKTFWHPAVVHARAAISDCTDENIKITEIANEVGLNVRYFIGLFKEATGLSPHQYQIAMRVERARGMIQSQRTSLCEVAVSAGFSDQSHLNRQFKRRYGYTPGGFNQMVSRI